MYAAMSPVVGIVAKRIAEKVAVAVVSSVTVKIIDKKWINRERVRIDKNQLRFNV